MTNVLNVPAVIIAGFGSWIKTEVNPAVSVLGELKQQGLADVNLICLEVPVESDTLYPVLEQALLEHRPNIWIGLGVAVGSPVIRAEMVGLNMRHFGVPDNKGEKAYLATVIEGGPLAYSVSLPNQIVVKQLREAKIPVRLSFHAGTHLCNQMIYSVSHIVEKYQLNTVHGFLHIPQSTSNVAMNCDDSEFHQIESSMSLKMMTEAVRLAIKSVVASHNSYNNHHNHALRQIS